MVRRIFSFDNIFRLFVVPVLALVLVHLVSYEKLPYEAGYKFPLVSYLIILMFGLVICEINRFNYRHLNKTLSFRYHPGQRIIRQVLYNFAGTVISFTILSYLINGGAIPLVIFLKYLLIVLMISMLETAFFVMRDFYYLFKKDKALLQPLLIKSGNRSFKITPDKIAYFISKGGIVSLVTNEGESLITHFDSLTEVEEILDRDIFFRLNRQFLVRDQAIKSVTTGNNRKLKITLDPLPNSGLEQVVVSRYRRNAFRKWFAPAG